MRLNPATKRLINFGSECTYLKDFIRGNLNRLQYFNQIFFEEVSRRKGTSWQSIACLTYTEIVDLLKNKQKFDKRKYFILFSEKKRAYWLINNNAKNVIRKINAYLPQESNVVKGTSASRGKIKGLVKIVRRMNDLRSEEKFVLVSPMTTPDLIPAMKKSIAIVTDEGGLTCHAAIMSRELGIPCIIGTRIATKFFKNGDTVEVDANNGIVRKI